MKRLKFIFLTLLGKIRWKILGKYSFAIIFKSKNGIIAGSIEDLVIGKGLGFHGHWDMGAIKIISNYIKETDCLFVIGAHIGTLLVPLSKKVDKVYGYEANPHTYELLNWNIYLNGLSNVKVFNYAIGDENKKSKFYANKINSGGSKIKPVFDNFLYNYDNPEIINVDMISLDNHIVSEKLNYPNVIIMDIEGAEYFALKGSQTALSKSRILYIEYVAHHLVNVSNVDNKSLLDLILIHFDTVISMKTSETFNLRDSCKYFEKYLDKLMKENDVDDLMFIKTIPNNGDK